MESHVSSHVLRLYIEGPMLEWSGLLEQTVWHQVVAFGTDAAQD